MSRSSEHGKGRSLRNYHKCLRVITDDISESQGYTRRVLGYVHIGNQIRLVRLFFPLSFVIGDGKSSDALVGRYLTSFCHLRSRLCDCPPNELSNPFRQCRILDNHLLQQKSSRAAHLLRIATSDAHELQEELNLLIPELSSYSRHILDNAFNCVHFGANENGILGATPCDPMHMFLHGVLKYVIKIFVENLTRSEKAVLDRLVHHTFSRMRLSAKKEFPRCNYVRGITNLTMITADEWAGVAFTLVLVFHNRQGWALLATSLERQRKQIRRQYGNFDSIRGEYERLQSELATLKSRRNSSRNAESNERGVVSKKMSELNSRIKSLQTQFRRGRDAAKAKAVKEQTRIFLEERENNDQDNPPVHMVGASTNAETEFAPTYVCTPVELLNLLETMLCFYTWYKTPPHYKWKSLGMAEEAQFSIPAMMSLILTTTPRLSGEGWDICKYHDHLHIVEQFMVEFGSAMNFDAANGEHSLIHFAKRVYQKVQKHSQETVMVQSAKLHQRYMSVRKARRCFEYGIPSHNKTDSETDLPEPGQRTGPVGNPKYRIHLQSSGAPIVQWLTKKEILGNCDIHPLVLDYFHNEFAEHPDKFPGGYVDCYTEHLFDGDLLRAHPNFRSNGHWYDWTTVLFDVDNEETESSAYCHYGHNQFPSKVLCFWIDNMTTRDMGLSGVKALIHSTKRFDKKASSALCEIWEVDMDTHGRNHLKPIVLCVDVESMSGHRLFVAEESPGIRESIGMQHFEDYAPRVMVVKPVVDWSVMFTTHESDPNE